VNHHSLKIYFAGDLFDAKDLGGNLLLARAIEKISCGRFVIMLPQNGECEVQERNSLSIRDADFELLYDCDLMIANFDGCDLDSGTVTEFCFAKMVDMPTLLLRTDFRNSGDSTLPDGDPWNLMCSHYPRTEVLHINSMVRYHQCKARSTDTESLLTGFYHSIAAEAVAALEKLLLQPSWLSPDEIFHQYRMAVKSAGGSLAELLPESRLKEITERKKAAGI
jgi:hypothetical protein